MQAPIGSLSGSRPLWAKPTIPALVSPLEGAYPRVFTLVRRNGREHPQSVHDAAPTVARRVEACPGIKNARRNRSPSRSLPPGASTLRLVVTASTDLTVLVRCLSGQDVMYPAPSWARYPLIHDFRGLEGDFAVTVHSPSTKGPSETPKWPVSSRNRSRYDPWTGDVSPPGSPSARSPVPSWPRTAGPPARACRDARPGPAALLRRSHRGR